MIKISFDTGNLIEHHVKILMNNPYYRGVAIPEPDVLVRHNELTFHTFLS